MVRAYQVRTYSEPESDIVQIYNTSGYQDINRDIVEASFVD